MTTATRIKGLVDLAVGTLQQAADAAARGDASAAEASLQAAQRQIDSARLLNAKGQTWEARVQDEILRRRPV